MLNYVPLAGKVCTGLCKVLPRTRSPSSPTQQKWQKEDVRKDVINASQSDTINKYPATKPKISVQIPASYTPNIAPPSFMLPVPGRPLPLAFQKKQPQVPVEFRGPGVQMQSIGSVSSSLPVKMAVPMGNAPHIQPFCSASCIATASLHSPRTKFGMCTSNFSSPSSIWQHEYCTGVISAAA